MGVRRAALFGAVRCGARARHCWPLMRRGRTTPVACQVCGHVTTRRYGDRVVRKVVCEACFEPHRVATERLMLEDKERSQRTKARREGLP